MAHPATVRASHQRRSPLGLFGLVCRASQVSETKCAQARAGLSLADVAGHEFSRTFLHFVETGRSRPSQAVLSLIARRTGRPISYFLSAQAQQPRSSGDLATDLMAIAARVRRLISDTGVDGSEYEALKLLELMARRGSQLARVIEHQYLEQAGSRRITLQSKKAVRKAS
jgi:transcriptional regulator with XRE-family HTH domain